MKTNNISLNLLLGISVALLLLSLLNMNYDALFSWKVNKMNYINLLTAISLVICYIGLRR